MAIKDLINHPDFLLLEEIIKKKMLDLCFDFNYSKGQSMEELGLEAMANKKAYTLLDNFLKDVGFFKGEDKMTTKRDFR